MAQGLTPEDWERLLDQFTLQSPLLQQWYKTVQDSLRFGTGQFIFGIDPAAPEPLTMNDQTPSLENSLDRLIKIMKMTTASVDGEALAAIRMANAQLAKLKTDWEAVLRGKISIIEDPFGGVPVVAATQRQPAPPPAQPKAQPATSSNWTQTARAQPNPSWTNPSSGWSAAGAQSRPKPAPRFPHTDDVEIEGYFNMVKMKKWGKKTSTRLSGIQSFWQAHHGLNHTDFDFLKQCATGGTAAGSVDDL